MDMRSLNVVLLKKMYAVGTELCSVFAYIWFYQWSHSCVQKHIIYVEKYILISFILCLGESFSFVLCFATFMDWFTKLWCDCLCVLTQTSIQPRFSVMPKSAVHFIFIYLLLLKFSLLLYLFYFLMFGKEFYKLMCAE